ncbi:MAG: ATP-grasp domain-containing protein [Bdellovibrionales bacterium]|nr:ATP-grasp domain-containing protein [Bdellovibrionales bacterium]
MSSPSREPVLIANRGEIAIRVARTARALGFPTVAVYSDADRFAPHVQACDRAYWIGASEPRESYLNIDRIVGVAKAAGARFVHPGYGFLSERPRFVEACQRAGLVFVGPSAENMERMGDKIQARATADELQVPRVPGSAGAVKSPAEAASVASKIGYPVLLKAAAGGGGKGMRRVNEAGQIAAAFEGASREALSAFGDGAMYVEKLILEPHHVEIQVFGDGKGGAIHLGERECSVQRRHQKVLEESPSPVLNQFPDTRPRMFEAAVRITKHLRYAGAGTLEFIVDGEGNYYFLEMNTRLQVEHPVTEWVTGVDLVAMQLLLAAGELALPTEGPDRSGSSVEVRVYAEDPKNFLPAPGKIGVIDPPSGPFVRWDSAFRGPGEVSMFYDPMIAKLSVWGPTRAEALQRMRVALDELRIEAPMAPDGTREGSLKTNLGFLRRLVRNGDVLAGNTTTDLIEKHPELKAPPGGAPGREAAIAAALARMLGQAAVTQEGESGVSHSVWSWQARREGARS